MVTPEQALKVAKKIAKDIKGRRGIGDEMDQIEPSIQKEMIAEWAKIIQSVTE